MKRRKRIKDEDTKENYSPLNFVTLSVFINMTMMEMENTSVVKNVWHD
jgi:hypothetical protein